jgi:outer membrane protein assembly factor BamB
MNGLSHNLLARLRMVGVLGVLGGACLVGWLSTVSLPAAEAPSAKTGGASGANAGRIESYAFAKDDWPWWRGLQGTGVVPADQAAPWEWSETKNVLWKVAIPGRAHGSPIVVGTALYLTLAEPKTETQSVAAYDRATGKELWRTTAHKGNFDKKGNAKSSHASSTLACDGERLFATFLNDGAIHCTALTRDGKIVWTRRVGDFVNHQGFGSSPVLYGPLVLVSADSKVVGGKVVGLDRVTGEVRWTRERPKLPNYTSPVVLSVAGRDQCVLIGCDRVESLDPLTGKLLWEMAGSTEECVTTTVTDGTHIYTTGGYPKNHVAAIVADGSGKVAWSNGSRVYVPSMVIREGYLYAVLDAGMAACWKADTGEEVWKERIGGTFSASLVLVGDRILATDEAGRTCVWKASPEKFEKLGENQLGDEGLATPVIAGGKMYHRAATTKDGVRQEWLYCVGVR